MTISVPACSKLLHLWFAQVTYCCCSTPTIENLASGLNCPKFFLTFQFNSVFLYITSKQHVMCSNQQCMPFATMLLLKLDFLHNHLFSSADYHHICSKLLHFWFAQVTCCCCSTRTIENLASGLNFPRFFLTFQFNSVFLYITSKQPVMCSN